MIWISIQILATNLFLFKGIFKNWRNNVLKQKDISKTLLLLFFPILGLTACSKTDKINTTTEAHQETPTETQVAPTEKMTTDFDISKIPISNVSLGEFPYITLPKGYQFQENTSVNFEKTPLWTGQHIEFVEGQLFSAAIYQDENAKGGSFLELQRNFEHVIQQLGGQPIANSQITQAEIEKIPQKFQVDYVSGLGDVFNHPTQTFVVRQANKNIWFQLTQSGNNRAGLLIAETQPVQITAQALTSDQLKTALDKDNKVNIQVNFATDQANILPDSQPQIDQVIQLLKKFPELRLSVNGHTDNLGDAKYNQQLSQQRAQAVVEALTANTNIDKKRLIAKGFGATQPLVENTTAEAKALNRRVELLKIQ